MKVKDIEKKLSVSIDGASSEELIPKEEYIQMVFECYKKQLMDGNIDKVVKSEFDKYSKDKQKLEVIKKITFVKNGTFNDREEFNDFIAVTGDERILLLYNLTTGEDLSFYKFKDVILYENTTMYPLYIYDDKDIQMDLEFGYCDYIKLYKSANLINNYNDKVIKNSDFIEIRDRLGSAIYVDINNYNIYTRQGVNSLDLSKCKNIKDIYSYGECCNVLEKDFKNFWYIIKNFFIESEYDD